MFGYGVLFMALSSQLGREMQREAFVLFGFMAMDLRRSAGGLPRWGEEDTETVSIMLT